MRQILQAWKARWTSRGWGNWQAKERKAGHLSASDTKQGQMRSQKTHIRQGKKKKRAEECAECGKVSRHSCGIRKGVKILVSNVEKLQWPIGRKRSTREFCFECIRKQRPVRQNSRGTRIVLLRIPICEMGGVVFKKKPANGASSSTWLSKEIIMAACQVEGSFFRWDWFGSYSFALPTSMGRKTLRP